MAAALLLLLTVPPVEGELELGELAPPFGVPLLLALAPPLLEGVLPFELALVTVAEPPLVAALVEFVVLDPPLGLELLFEFELPPDPSTSLRSELLLALLLEPPELDWLLV